MNMIKQLFTNQTSSKWKKANKMRHLTVIADLNVAQKKSRVVTYFVLAYCIPVYVSFTIVKNWCCNGIYNFSNIFSIKKCYFNVKTVW